MRWFIHLRIKYKLFLLLLLPLLGLGYFAQTILLSKLSINRDMAEVQALAQLAINTSNVFYHLQKERSISGMYLRSDGEDFADQLRQTYALTDPLLQTYFNWVHQIQIRPFYPSLQPLIEAAHQALKQLKVLRATVMDLNMVQQDMFKNYTKINQHLLDLITKIIGLTSQTEILKRGLNYLNLMQIREEASLEEFILGEVLVRKAFVEGQYQEFVELVVLQTSRLERSLVIFSTEEQKKFIQNQWQGEILQETQRIRQVAYQSFEGLRENIDPEHWFIVQNEKIDLLKQIEDKLAIDFSSHAAQIKNQAQTDFYVALSSTIGIILLTLLLVYLVLISITCPLHKAVYLSKAIAGGKLDNPIAVTQQDETGELLTSFAEMQNQLRQRIANETTHRQRSLAN